MHFVNVDSLPRRVDATFSVIEKSFQQDKLTHGVALILINERHFMPHEP